MSDRPDNSSASGDRPLFQNTDRQEQIYAPDQIPAAMPEHEIDADGGQTRARGASDQAESVAGAEGDPGTVPIVPVRPDLSSNTPINLPAVTDAVRDDDSSNA